MLIITVLYDIILYDKGENKLNVPQKKNISSLKRYIFYVLKYFRFDRYNLPYLYLKCF